MDSPFMVAMAEGLAAQGHRVARFEFPYMAERRETGKKRPPNPQRILLETWNAVIDELGPDGLIIGGKSMGGRMASIVARMREDEGAQVKGCVCLGYPFHPPGKPEKLRTEHLADLQTPTLICQGERDTFGTKDEVPGYSLSDAIQVTWLPDGDHGFKPRKASGYTEEQNWQRAIAAITQFAKEL